MKKPVTNIEDQLEVENENLAFRACLFLLIVFSPNLAHSQDRTQEPIRITVSPEKGVHFESADGFMEFRMGFRLQQQIALTQIVSEQDALQGEYDSKRTSLIPWISIP